MGTLFDSVPVTLAEQALAVVIEQSDPRTTLAPMILMRLCRSLAGCGLRSRRNCVEDYLRWEFLSRYEFEIGSAVTNGRTPHSLYSVTRTTLGGVGNHGVTYSVNRPCWMTVDLNEENMEETQMSLEMDGCAEYHRRLWRRGKLHGQCVTLHTCHDDSEAAEVRMYRYVDGKLNGTTISVFRETRERPTDPPATQIRVVLIEFDDDEEIERHEATLPANHVTRRWTDFCGEHLEDVRNMYEKMIEEGFGKERMILDEHWETMPDEVQQMVGVVW